MRPKVCFLSQLASGAANLHVARTVCRRAEIDVHLLAQQDKIGAQVQPYLNRLSDALFVMADRKSVV